MPTRPLTLLLLLLPLLPWAAAQEFTSGFEPDEPANSWMLTDNGMSQVVTDQFHSGSASLKVTDPDEKVGSSARSISIPATPGQIARLTLWLRLEAGDPNGLGVYYNFTDAAGKRLNEPSEAAIQRPTMKPGEWVFAQASATVPDGAAGVGVWLHTFSTAAVTCIVDDVKLQVMDPGEFGPATAWTGGVLDDQTRKVWPFAVRWDHRISSSIQRTFDPPADWSGKGALRLWVHSAAPNRSTFMVIANSENPDSEGADYFAVKITVDWEGWKELVLPVHELGRSREPVGWNKIDSIVLTASGWGQTVNPETVLVVDGVEPVEAGAAQWPPSDESLFDSLDLERPELAAVKAAVVAGDYAAAKGALAEHLRNRTTPRWTFDWRDAPMRGVKVPGPEQDKAPDQWDYYSTFITVDWEGWKLIRLNKEDLTPRAMVEGEGWKGKQPIGWHWIQYIAMNTKGWGLTPNPETVLYFDDVRLVGKDKTTILSDFEAGADDWSGLEASTERAKSGAASGKWGNQVLTTGIRNTNIPHDWTDYDALEMWVYSEKPTGSRMVVVLDSDVPAQVSAAEKALRREFDYTKGPGERGTITFGDRIDWTANPTEGEARTHLWNESINRHFHFRQLSEAYWNTGQEKYAEEIARQILDWTSSMPRPMLSNGNSVGHYAWQTLTTGIRLADTWPQALYRCMGSPAFDANLLAEIMKSVREQARHLVKWPSSGNWLTAESNGLFTAGMLFPEFKEAADWRRIAIERLYKQLDDEVYPDGMEYELAAGYNNWVVTEFAHILEMAEMNGLRGELPADYQDKLQKMFNYLLFASMPNGAIPGLNDSGNSDVRGLLTTGHKLFPEREDFRFVATAGAWGEAPEQTSYAFPWSGHYVMRSGWDANATFLLFDAGPYGMGHQHEDKLHFVLWSKGRQHLLDPGNFSYDRSRWRRYVLETYGHNTVMVDGENQNRGAKRETYWWPKPWQGDAPPENDTRWASTPEYDFAAGIYSDGYGEKNAIDVTHTRRVLYLKQQDLFVVLDALEPADEAEHTYEALFHLDTEEAQTLDAGVVRTLNEGQSNLQITPAPVLNVEIVKGKQDPPVQGWANGPWRAIPTAIYKTSGSGTVRMAFVLEPVAAGEEPKVTAAKVLTTEPGFAAVEISLADGGSILVIQRDEPGELVAVAGIETQDEMTVLTRGADGSVTGVLSFTGKLP